MQRSTDRILTTHTGSLPRPDDLVQLMFKKEEGEAVDRPALDARIASAVKEVVDKQRAAGIDIVNDGEMSKPSYATYVKDRLDGFGGASYPLAYQDLVDFPDLAARVFNDPGRSRRKTPACDRPISVKDPEAVRTDILNLRAAVGESAPSFITAASPGVIGLFFKNTYYPNYETYLYAIADAMRDEYRAVVEAGFILQLDCPDLGMGRHIQFAGATLETFRKNAVLHVEALNYALAGLPAESVRIHLCWGNYEGPHHYDVALRDIIDIAFRANVGAISFENANARHGHEWKIFRDVKLPDNKSLIPGVIDSKSNYIEHPELVAERLIRLGEIVGRDRVIAGTDCGFGTWVGMAKVDPGVVWRKFASMAEGARIATAELWR
jgi:5-methyltetrahydropteroyltriglutamate--homocysteine methyltransferase